MSHEDKELLRHTDNTSHLGNESIGENVQCIELLKAEPAELSDFHDRLGLSQGGLSVLIHPFYSDLEGTRLTSGHRYVTPEYIERRDEFLGDKLKQNVPFLVFEPEKTYTQLSTQIGKYGEGTAYTIKTQWDKHMPIGGEESWEKLIKILQDADINQVDLGGMFLMTYKSEIATYFDNGDVFKKFIGDMPAFAEKFPRASSWLKEDLAPIGCVGHAAIHFLNSGIDVSLSPVATPVSGNNHIHMELVPNDEEF